VRFGADASWVLENPEANEDVYQVGLSVLAAEPLRLGAPGSDELRGSNFFFGRVGLLWSLADENRLSFFGKLWLAAFYEVGDACEDQENPFHDLTFGMARETIMGAVLWAPRSVKIAMRVSFSPSVGFSSPMIKRNAVVVASLVVVGGAIVGCNAGTNPDAGAAAPAAAATAAAVQLPAEVERLADNVYLFTQSTHRSLFVVTDEAVLATDPQGSQANAERFVQAIGEMTEAPIRQVVYSHHHGDHILGGAAFPADAEFIAHRNAEAHLVGSEARSVDRFVGDDETIDVGGLQVRLIYPGASETDSSLIIFIPDRRVAFMVDAVAVRTLPWRTMDGADPRDWISALERLDELDFDILAPGHGPTGHKSDVRENIIYLQTLVAAVQQGIDEGQTLEEIQNTLELPEYADWMRYDEHFKENIQGVYRELAGG